MQKAIMAAARSLVAGAGLSVVTTATAYAVVDNEARCSGEFCSGAMPEWVVVLAFIGCLVGVFYLDGAGRWLSAFGAIITGIFSGLILGVISFEVFKYGMFALMLGSFVAMFLIRDEEDKK